MPDNRRREKIKNRKWVNETLLLQSNGALNLIKELRNRDKRFQD